MSVKVTSMVRYSVMSLESCKISGCKRRGKINTHAHDPTPQGTCFPHGRLTLESHDIVYTFST